VFFKPVDLVLPFDPARLPAGADATSAQLRMAPHGSTSFAALQSSVDVTAKTIFARTIHFTQFVPAQNPNPVIRHHQFWASGRDCRRRIFQSLAATGNDAVRVVDVGGSTLPQASRSQRRLARRHADGARGSARSSLP